ncbi:MAG TPA: hypothetical protein PLH25_10215 [Flavobacterium sp.]|jgi:hypothetical protein|nr:hypothetical protein [Flavobacterium sp.]
MKKIFCILTFVAVAFSYSSCSSDSDSKSSDMSAKINGAAKTFKNATVTEEVYDEYTDFIVDAIQSDDATKMLSISLGKDTTGSESVYFIQYFDGDVFYQASESGITANITESSNTKIKGTFSAILTSESGSTVTVSNGVINVAH